MRYRRRWDAVRGLPSSGCGREPQLTLTQMLLQAKPSSKRKLGGKCSRWGFGRARWGGEWIPASNAARADGSRLSGRVAGGVGRRRCGGVPGGEGRLADESPIVGEDDEDSQGSICYHRAADQAAVEHAQDAAPGTGDPGAAREQVGGLAHPGEL